MSYREIGTALSDGTFVPYGSTVPKAGYRNDPIVVGKKYILASGAHTGGTAQAEATCLAVNGSNALMITHGLYGAAWPGSGELDISSYMGGLSVAVDDVYLPRAQGGITGPTTTTPTGVSVYWNGAWTDNYSANVKSILATAAQKYSSVGASDGSGQLGTLYDASNVWLINTLENFVHYGTGSSRVIAPTFILDLNRVQISGAYISLANPEGQIDASNVTYGGGTVADALDGIGSVYKLADNELRTYSSSAYDIALPTGVKLSDYNTIFLLFNTSSNTMIGGSTAGSIKMLASHPFNTQVSDSMFLHVRDYYDAGKYIDFGVCYVDDTHLKGACVNNGHSDAQAYVSIYLQK